MLAAVLREPLLLLLPGVGPEARQFSFDRRIGLAPGLPTGKELPRQLFAAGPHMPPVDLVAGLILPQVRRNPLLLLVTGRRSRRREGRRSEEAGQSLQFLSEFGL